MLLTKIRTAFFAVRHPRNARRTRRAERCTCGCTLEMLSLYDGQHSPDCTDNRFTVKPTKRPKRLLPHNVEGVVMPAAWPTSPDLDRRWCDLTMPGGRPTIARNWPGAYLLGTAIKYEGGGLDDAGWHWWVSEYDADPASEGQQTDLGSGVADSVEEVIKLAQEVVDQEIAARELLDRLRRSAS